MKKTFVSLFFIFSLFFCFSQNYVKTNLWQDNTLMDNTKVDGLIFIKQGNDFYVDKDFTLTKAIKLDNVAGNNDTEKFENSIKLLKRLNGGTLLINNNIVFDRPVHISNIRGIEIIGNKSSYSLQGGLFTGSTISFINNAKLSISDFIDLKLYNINLINTVPNHTTILELFKGYDFQLENLKIRSTSSNQSIAIALGKNNGENAVFQGKISRVNITNNDGGIGILSGDSNTSLTFENCYLQGCSFNIEGTIYSSFISCAVDGSPTNAYNLKKGEQSSTHSLTFISCGAESAEKSGWYIDSGTYLIELIAPHSGLNNVGKHKNIGELITIDKTENGEVSNISISSPSSFNGSKLWDIYIASPEVGKVNINNIYDKAIPYGIGYHKKWETSRLKIN